MFTPVSLSCKQEHREHAWLHIFCGRNMNLSAAPGLRLDTISACTSCFFLDERTYSYASAIGCKKHIYVAYSIWRHPWFSKGWFKAWIYHLYKHTHRKKMLNYRGYWESEFLRGKTLLTLHFKRKIWDFPRYITFGRSFLSARVQTIRGTVASSAAGIRPVT